MCCMERANVQCVNGGVTYSSLAWIQLVIIVLAEPQPDQEKENTGLR